VITHRNGPRSARSRPTSAAPARRCAVGYGSRSATAASGRGPTSDDRERLADAGIEPSVCSVGDSYDNALAETINGLYKAEVIHRRGSCRGFDAVELATLEWIDRFNHRRLMEAIGNIPSAEAENRCYSMLDQPALAA